MYMGWPVDSTYEAVSNVTMAGNLKGKLLLVHGALDDNVNASATFKLAENLVRENKDFDLVIFPSQRHSYQGDYRKYFYKKRWNFFIEHLLGREPLWDYDDQEAGLTADLLLEGIISDYEFKPEYLKSGLWPSVDSTFFSKELDWLKGIERRLSEIDSSALSFQNRINFDLLSLLIRNRVYRNQFGDWQLPLNAEGGFIAGVLYQVKSESKSNIENYLKLLDGIPAYFESQIKAMQSGQKRGRSHPKLVAEKSAELADFLLNTSAEESFYLDGVAENDRAAVLSKVQNDVYPAYQKLSDFLKGPYLENAPENPGISEIKDGKAYYEQRVRFYTTTDISPEAVFNKGLEEVARIKGEMQAIIEELEFEGDYAAFLKFLREDPQFYARTPEELLAHAAWITKKMEGMLPKYFGKLPRMPLTVKPVPAAIAPNYTVGRYSPGSYSQNRAGEYWVNTTKLNSRALYALPALTLHEGVPGHHTQIMLAAEIDDLPAFRSSTYLSAYGEGWALYTEYLGKEAGIYSTLYEDFGRLTYEMWRACRLVVDPGMHYMGWSREKAFNFMADNTALSLHEVGTEIDRYIGWPGQAVSYKMGELKIRELRKKAEEQLGDKFDIRQFHDVVLENGSVPMATLQWIVEAKILQ